MEAFSLLKYWRGGGGVAGEARTTTGTTTIVAAVTHPTNETDEEDDDDGPFFDLEFAVPDEDEVEGGGDEQESHEDGNINRGDINGEEEDEEDEDGDVESTGTEEGEREFNFTLSSASSGGRTDPNLSLSPSDDLFFKGRLVPIEPSSLALNTSEANSKPQFPVSFLKSATKFRVFMLGLKKSKSTTAEKTEKTEKQEKTEKTESNGSASATPKQQHQKQETQQKQQTETTQQQSKLFTVKFKVEEVPIVSLFTRDNSSRSSSGNKSQKQNTVDESAADEKRFSKEVMQRYLKKVKPLYVRVSKRYGEKLRFSGQLSLGSGAKAATPPSTTATQKSSPPPPLLNKSTAVKNEAEGEVVETPAGSVKTQKQGNIPAGLRVVCKHLGKSRSASSAVAAVPSAPAPSRRDDSLLQQQDGIQSAILHCKRSFNASRDSESSNLSRSASDQSQEKLIELSRSSSEEAKVKACV